MNPYWTEFCRLSGGGPTWEFMAWVSIMWQAFDATQHGLDGQERAIGFERWLKSLQPKSI